MAERQTKLDIQRQRGERRTLVVVMEDISFLKQIILQHFINMVQREICLHGVSM